MKDWTSIDRLFDQALDLTLAERSKYLNKACENDPELRARLNKLLDLSDREKEGLELPIGRIAKYVVNELDSKSIKELIGQRVGSYEIERELGRGGMGVVFLAKQVDGELNRKVALKLLKSGLQSESIKKRFLREREVLASMQHKNIARLFEAGTSSDGRSYFAMEFIDGSPLDEHCSKLSLSIEKRLRLFCCVCEAVEYAHKNLVVHRDLKPGNILVDAEGEVKLLDFGVAKVMQEEGYDAKLTGAHDRPFTAAFASPEQIQGLLITTSADVYSLGVVLYQLMSGCLPFEFEGKSMFGFEQEILTGKPEKPSIKLLARQTSEALFQPGISSSALKGDIDTICLKAMASIPQDRYDSAQALKDDILRYLDGQVILAQQPSIGYRFRKFVARNRVGVLLGSLAILILITTTVSSLIQAKKAERSAFLAKVEETKAEKTVDFIVDLMEEFGPEKSKGQEMTPDLFVRKGISKFEDLDDEPQIQAEFMATMARISYRLAQYELSDSLWTRSLEIRLSEFGLYHEDVAASLVGLASNRLATERDFDDAIKDYKTAHEIYQSILGPNSPVTLRTKYDIGWAMYMKEDYNNATQVFQQLLVEFVRAGLDSSEDYFRTNYGLANIQIDQNDFERAIKLLRPCVDNFERIQGKRGIQALSSRLALADALTRNGEYLEAQSLFRELVPDIEDVYGENHNRVGNLHNRLGRLFTEMEKYPEALESYSVSLRSFNLSLGSGHFFTTYPLRGIGDCFARQGLWSLAEENYAAGIAVIENLEDIEPNHSLVLDIRTKYAISLLEQKKAVQTALDILSEVKILLENMNAMNPQSEALLTVVNERLVGVDSSS